MTDAVLFADSTGRDLQALDRGCISPAEFAARELLLTEGLCDPNTVRASTADVTTLFLNLFDPVNSDC